MRVHIVQKGDTLWKIAKQYAIGFEELKRLNAHLANPDYIVPGMEIYLPDTVQKKETKNVVTEQPKPVKEQPVQGPKPAPAPTPAPRPQPAPAPMPQPQKPFWQGDIYLQPAPQPMPVPNWQTNVHVQPSFENTIQAPPPQAIPQPAPQPQPMPMPMPMPQPIYIPQMMPQQPIIYQQMPQQPVYMQQPPQMMPQMPVCAKCQQPVFEEAMCMPPQMYPMPMPLPVHPQMQPVMHEESSHRGGHCQDHEQVMQHYYGEIDAMMRQQYPCCPPQMMPYPANVMPDMQQMPQQPKSCH